MKQIGLILIIYLQQTVTLDLINDKLLHDENPCARTCIKNASPMVCTYNFTVEWYYTMSTACNNCPIILEDCFQPDCLPGEGSARPVLVVNKQIPGPTIEVCVGDEIIVDVNNHLPDQTTSIHWHGFHQKGTPYMDGVPRVTQCPIQAENTFRYNFKVVNPGTHFWHSHDGLQQADGLLGSIIARVPKEFDLHNNLYDYDLIEHVIITTEWSVKPKIFRYITALYGGNDNNEPYTYLINGKGRSKKFYNDKNETIYTPISRFTVEQGYRYKFRVINAGSADCPIEMEIDNHTLTLINSDGNDIKPVKVKSFAMYPGERFDFILTADQPKDVYWIHIRKFYDDKGQLIKNAHQEAILQYKEVSTDKYPVAITAKDFNTDLINKKLQITTVNDTNKYLSIADLRYANEWDIRLKEKPDFKFYLSLDSYEPDNPLYHKNNIQGFSNVTKGIQLPTPQLNHITMKYLSFPLLSGRDQIKDNMFCNESTVQNCDAEFCECTHVIQVPLGKEVEMILIDGGRTKNFDHPFHLHGHSFQVVAIEVLGENTTQDEVIKRDNNGLIKRNLINAPLKDTVMVPDGGYTIIRVTASNPGYWLFHCHIIFHVQKGMALVFKFGEHHEMPSVPSNFPSCGNYLDRQTLLNDNVMIRTLQNKTSGFADVTFTASSSSLRNTIMFTIIILPLILFFV